MTDEQLLKALLNIFGVTRQQLEEVVKGTIRDEILQRILFK